jgi:pimeloyl-ACP methyl ester carboxylesterase
MSGAAAGAESPPGEVFEIFGRRMHLCRRGAGDGLPTVVIEAGNSMCGAAYARLQMGLSAHTQVVTYDRSGLGWSDNDTEPKDAEHVAAQLHALLQRAGVAPPIVLAGHSIGGLFLRVYAGKYPGEVCGAVFLDATHPRLSEALGGNQWIADTCEFYRTQKEAVGHGNLHESDAWFVDSFADLPHVQAELRHAALQPLRYDVSIETLEAFEATAAQVMACGDLGDRPVLSVTAPELVRFDEWLPAFSGYLSPEKKSALHAELAALSTHGRHITVEGAEHGNLTSDRWHAAIVVEEMLDLVREAARARRRAV